MKILFVNTNIGYGGASKIMAWVANMLSAKGHDITIFTYRDSSLLQPLAPEVTHVHRQLEDNDGRKKIFSTSKYLRKYIKDNGFELAIGFLTPSQLRLAIACIGLPIKLLFSQRGDPYDTNHGLGGILSSAAFKRADHYVFQTRNARDFYSTAIRNKSVVIANPIVPLKRTMPREGNIKKTIVNACRLQASAKRQDILIEAFNMISEDFPDYTLELWGDGPDQVYLKELAKSNPKIKFMGKTDNVVSACQNASLFVLSSDSEGIPNALLEAMSLGVPCVSTDCRPGGAALLIRDHSNGLLVERSNPKALADAMAFMLSNPGKAEAMGKQATRVSIDFSEEAIANQWLNFINGIK